MSWDWQDLGLLADGVTSRGGPTPETQEAQREAELNEAFQKGLREGEAAGRKEVLAEVEPARQAAQAASSALAAYEAEIESRLSENVMALALAVARKVVDREVRADPGIVAELVEKALAHFPLDQKVRVRLNPADLAFVTGEGPGRRAPEAGGREVRWMPDESVARGGCLVEGPEHVVDGRLDSVLERIYRTVFHD